MTHPAFVAVFAALALSACVASPYESQLSGDSPANFYYKSDGENALALLVALESGQAVRWSVDDSSFGAVTPTGDGFTDRANRLCRPLKAERDGLARMLTACRGGDGTWVVAEWKPERAD